MLMNNAKSDNYFQKLVYSFISRECRKRLSVRIFAALILHEIVIYNY